MEEGIKYLGFKLKPNDYRKTDWMWLIVKIKKILNIWCHRWLSQVGILVLIKYESYLGILDGPFLDPKRHSQHNQAEMLFLFMA